MVDKQQPYQYKTTDILSARCSLVVTFRQLDCLRINLP